MKILIRTTTLFFFSCQYLAAGFGPTEVSATRITNKSAPFIDGVLDESVWSHAGELTFPNPTNDCSSNPAGDCCFTVGYQRYRQTDPSTFRARFLHDDFNLYVAVETDDGMVESSEYDQSSDGLAGLAIARPDGETRTFRLLWFDEPLSPLEGRAPVDRDQMVTDAAWRSRLDEPGYTFEFSIPLADPESGATSGLGGWVAGDRMPANLVVVDHDSKPGARFDDPQVNFRKCWWGSDQPDGLVPARWIVLGAGAPIGEPGDDRTVTAKRITPLAAPMIDGRPDEGVWQQAGKLRFPNSVGRSFTPGGTQSEYNADDPTSYVLYFLHDDETLFVALESDDRRIEAAGPTEDHDQASDGLISLAMELRQGMGDTPPEKRYSVYWHELDKWEAGLHIQEGPPRYPYDTPYVTWGPTITGTWNDNSDLDGGYSWEMAIPLGRLGGYGAGDLIPANVVVVDHDDHPNGAFDDPATHFKKSWWGFDGNEFYPPELEGARRSIPPGEERFVELDDGTAYSECGSTVGSAPRALRYLVGTQLEHSGLLRSFSDEVAAHTYDMSVGLLAFVAGGRHAEAAALATALVGLLESSGDEGFFYDSYNVVDRRVPQGAASGTGPNTWAAFALAKYGKTYGDASATEAAEKVKRWLVRLLYDPSDGGVWGGVSHPVEENGDHLGDTVFPFKSTEQVIDTWHLLEELQDPRRENVLAWLTDSGKGWVETDTRLDPCRCDARFSTGWNPTCLQDRRLFLDAQSWGSIVASQVGDETRAAGAVQAAEKLLRVEDLVDGQTIVGFGDSCLPDDGVVWFGGTCQMVAAYVYKGDDESARDLLAHVAGAQNSDGSWNHSSRDSHTKHVDGCCNTYESFHRAAPHVGETAWCYFATRDVSDGLRLPYELSGGPVEIGLVFADGFESGDTCAWSSP